MTAKSNKNALEINNTNVEIEGLLDKAYHVRFTRTNGPTIGTKES